MWQTHLPTYWPTYRPTNTARCSVACTRLKINFSIFFLLLCKKFNKIALDISFYSFFMKQHGFPFNLGEILVILIDFCLMVNNLSSIFTIFLKKLRENHKIRAFFQYFFVLSVWYLVTIFLDDIKLVWKIYQNLFSNQIFHFQKRKYVVFFCPGWRGIPCIWKMVLLLRVEI